MLANVALAQEKLIPAWLQPVVLLDLLQARGVQLPVVLRGTALFIDDLPFTDHYINPRHFERLLESAHRHWHGGDFCFQLGHRLASDGVGPLREALSETRSLRHWLETVHQYQALITPSLSSRLYLSGTRDYFLLFNSVISTRCSNLALRCAASLLTHWLKRSGLNVQVEVFFRESVPEDMALFHSHIAGRCHFSSPFDGLRVRALDDEADGTTSSLRAQVAIRQSEALCGSRQYLLAYLYRMLWTVAAEPLSLHCCAGQLDISPATLKRRLQEQDCTFQQIADQMRSERAVIELLMTGASVEQIGARLHYHDSSNFRRAFKRWTGMTPSSLKKNYAELLQAMF